MTRPCHCLSEWSVFHRWHIITQPRSVILLATCSPYTDCAFISGVGRNIIVGANKRGARRREWDAEGVVGVPFRSRPRVWGSVVSSPSGVRGGARSKIGFGAFWAWKNTSGDDRFVFVHICMPRNSMAYWQNHGLRQGTWCFGGGSPPPVYATGFYFNGKPAHDKFCLR